MTRGAGTLDNATIFTCGGTGLGEVDGRGGIPAEGAAIAWLSVVHGRLSAAYSATESAGAAGIVELTPPKACGLR